MTPITDAAQAAAWLEEHAISWVKTEGISIDGLVIGKHLSTRKFVSSLPLGNAITEFVLGYDIGGTPFLVWWDDWRREALGDFHQRPDLSTMVLAQDRPGTANVICDIVDLDGNTVPVCPRSKLREVVDRLDGHGFAAKASFEIEVMLYRESYIEARAKKMQGLTPMAHPAPLGYLHFNSRQQLQFLDVVLARLEGLGIPIEGWHDEAGPGQFELNIDPTDPIAACDRVVRIKQVLREVALEQGCSVTFMAKPSHEYGNGLHVHHSLSKAGAPMFYAPDGHELSDLTRHWIGGLMATMPAATSIFCPNINSYRRMIGFAAAPTVASWGEDDKSAAVRVLSRSPKAARIENRVAGGDANPYLVLAAVLAGGIAGIEKAIEPPPPLGVTGWGLPAGYPHLPNTITKAADAMAADTVLHSVLGADFCEYWVNTRRWEWLMFHTTGGDPAATTVTQWELDRLFEIV
ncbi:MAG TPA: glutamine synthetase family protein [Ilumatobacteraceae bacterium]